MSIDQFVCRHSLACLFVAIHTLLIGAYAWIELNHAWNDQNPTMLVMAALHVGDYPVAAVLHPIFDGTERLGTYLAALLVIGGAYWFCIGTIMTYAWRGIRWLLNPRRTLHAAN
jgi:hypothetical protein